MNTQQQTDCLRGKIRDWLVISLQNGTISLNQATNVAQVTLDLFSDGLQDEQLRLAIKTMESHFPDFYADIHTARELWISRRIAASLNEGERGILFLGKEIGKAQDRIHTPRQV